MEQKDYMLREIEKIGLIINSIRQKLFGGGDNLSLTTQEQFQTLSERLYDEINFDLDKFLMSSKEDSINYLSAFNGFSVENIELLAEMVSEKYPSKALQLLEYCNSLSKTYSFEREQMIAKLTSYTDTTLSPKIS